LKVGMLFWQLGMYDPTVSVLLTPKPVHAPGRLLQDCYSRPAGLYHRLAEKLGPFDLMYYWSPMAGMASSRWIAQATLAVWRDEKPDLLLTYLPQLDYSGHRAGPDAEAHRTGARELDALIAPLIEAAESTGGRAVVLSEYSFVPVFRAVAPNRALREAGFLAIREIALGEYLVPGDSRAFAMVDNQVAHVYFPASPRLRRAGPAAADLEADVRAARKVLESVPGVAAVLDHEAQAEAGLRHARSGELVLLAEPDAHFTYYWWLDDGRAPAFAPTVDIHAKPGFDPAELLFDLKTKAVPLSADAIQGSHGLVQASGKGWGAFLDTAPPRDLAGRQAVQATEVARLLVPPV
jgi:predicted AlkP superfamily pyrophosphatase or phosphodiesterase